MGTSDMQVFHDIFIWGECSFLKPVADHTTVLDICANVGYSTLIRWYLSEM